MNQKLINSKKEAAKEKAAISIKIQVNSKALSKSIFSKL